MADSARSHDDPPAGGLFGSIRSPLAGTAGVDGRPAAGEQPRWGLGDAAGGWVFAYVCAALLGSLILAAFGYSGSNVDDQPLSIIALQYPPLWLGFVGVPFVVAARKGFGWVQDFRLRVRAIDAPVGLVAGVVAQLVLVPLLAAPVLWLSDKSVDDLEKPARELAEKAHGTWGILLFAVIVGLLAPIAEEIFFRGLVLRAFEKRFGTAFAVGASSVIFAATHFQALQFLPLLGAGLVFALLAVRTDRLGPAIFAHIAFNMTTVVVLVTT